MDDTCAECGHLITEHDITGCLVGADGYEPACPCCRSPQNYDPTDD